MRGRRAYLEGLRGRGDLVLTTLRFPAVLDADGLELEVERRFRQWAWFTLAASVSRLASGVSGVVAPP